MSDRGKKQRGATWSTPTTLTATFSWPLMDGDECVCVCVSSICLFARPPHPRRLSVSVSPPGMMKCIFFNCNKARLCFTISPETADPHTHVMRGSECRWSSVENSLEAQGSVRTERHFLLQKSNSVNLTQEPESHRVIHNDFLFDSVWQDQDKKSVSVCSLLKHDALYIGRNIQIKDTMCFMNAPFPSKWNILPILSSFTHLFPNIILIYLIFLNILGSPLEFLIKFREFKQCLPAWWDCNDLPTSSSVGLKTSFSQSLFSAPHPHLETRVLFPHK